MTTYFGAATLTEWEAALAHEANFRFVVATTVDGEWISANTHLQSSCLLATFHPSKSFLAYRSVTIHH